MEKEAVESKPHSWEAHHCCCGSLHQGLWGTVLGEGRDAKTQRCLGLAQWGGYRTAPGYGEGGCGLLNVGLWHFCYSVLRRAGPLGGPLRLESTVSKCGEGIGPEPTVDEGWGVGGGGGRGRCYKEVKNLEGQGRKPLSPWDPRPSALAPSPIP